MMNEQINQILDTIAAKKLNLLKERYGTFDDKSCPKLVKLISKLSGIPIKNFSELDSFRKSFYSFFGQ